MNSSPLRTVFRSLLLVATACSLSACSTSSRYLPFQSRSSGIERSSYDQPVVSPAPGSATLSGPIVPPPLSPSVIQQTAAWQEASPVDESAIEFTPAEARTDAPVQFAGHEVAGAPCPPYAATPGCPPGTCRQCQIQGALCQACASEAYPDEYICDGGDRGLPFHYEANSYAGFESEDTIAEYQDHLGEPEVKISSRVCVYAPRFAAVRTVSLPTEGTVSQFASGTDKTLQIHDLNSEMGTTFHNDYAAIGGVRMRSRASGLGSETDPDTLGQTTVAGVNDKLQNVFQNLTFLSTGRFEQTEAAVIAEGMTAAETWSRLEFPVISAHTSAANQVKATFKPMDITGLEDWRKTRGDLQIVKLADKKTAVPGDVITFTIRYDNLGDFELKNIRVVDNLTPRLQFIEGSADFGDRAGELQTFDNSEGSLILSFKLNKDLPGHTGGTITFQTRVRPVIEE
jgi:uncharacterized repeat protein (TIGR01451 family)